MSLISQFTHTDIPPEAEALRLEVRAFLQEALAGRPYVDRSQSWFGFDAEFSRKLGARGWVGMALPKKYGGHEMGYFTRYVIVEELLAQGAPVGAHWIADRQSGPLILRYGTEEQRQKYLPPICAGESYFCIGMSEPNSGSDLASITSVAKRDGDGWVLNGRKVWTTNGHKVQYMIALVRTSEADPNQRHQGMSQFIVDLTAPGVTVRPIRDLTGDAHFNEVFFDDVRLTDAEMVGQEGSGWEQVMAELAFERSGPDRFLSCMPLILTLMDAVGANPNPAQAQAIGRIVARIATLRQMSIATTALLDAGQNPTWHATCVKELGTTLEQEIPEIAQLIVDIEPRVGSGSDFAQTLALTMQSAPSYSLRGGTREILRGILARGLGLR